MTLQFQYDLTGTGWAESIFEINRQSATVSASYRSDALYVAPITHEKGGGLCSASFARSSRQRFPF